MFRLLVFGLVVLALLFSAPVLDENSYIYANETISVTALDHGAGADHSRGVPVLRRLRGGGGKLLRGTGRILKAVLGCHR